LEDFHQQILKIVNISHYHTQFYCFGLFCATSYMTAFYLSCLML